LKKSIDNRKSLKDLSGTVHKLLHADRTSLDLCHEKIFQTKTMAEFAGLHTAVFDLMDCS
jgi:hypothetical protein